MSVGRADPFFYNNYHKRPVFAYIESVVILFWNATIDFCDYLLERMKDIIKREKIGKGTDQWI